MLNFKLLHLNYGIEKQPYSMSKYAVCFPLSTTYYILLLQVACIDPQMKIS